MARFCAALSSHDPGAEILRLGGQVTYQMVPCGLGVIPYAGVPKPAGPFYAADGLVAVGEVSLFNRADLLANFRGRAPTPTASDGEFLLWLYARAGFEGLAQVDGMVAMAIWDGESLLLIRDAIGTRPLFYTQAADYWVAASDLRAIRRWPRLPVDINYSAVAAFLTFAYLPGQETLLAGVSQVAPGTAVRLRMDADPEIVSYWEPREQAWSSDTPAETYASHLQELVETAIKTRLPTKEPVGVYLSGGLDSSLVTAVVAQQHDYPVYTYAINFGRELPNELGFSSLVAQHCNTHHTILTFTGQQIAAELRDTVAMLDCPVGDPLTVPNLLLGRAAAADGLRVILNGEGGDPCFGGPKNIPMLLYEYYRTNADPLARAQAYLRAYRKGYEHLPRLLSRAVQAELKKAPPLENLVLPYLQAESMPHYLNKLMYANLRLKGAYHILPKVERLTAHCGLEGRSPLFAPQIAAYSFAIPPTLKLSGISEKWILKRAMADALPRTIIERPKSGMRVPVQAWLNGPLRRLAHDVLLGRTAQRRNLFQLDTIRQWMRGEGMLWPRHGAMLWLVLTLELWLQAYIDD